MQAWRRIREAWRQRGAAWVRRRQGEDTLPVDIQRRRVYILPTRAGLGLAVLLLFMLIAGLNYGNNLALLATFLLMGFTLVGMNLCHRNLQGLRIVAAATRPGFAGAQGQLDLTLEPGGPRSRFAIQLACAQAHALAPRVDLGGSRVELAIPTPKRGLQNLERFEIATTFPFGLFRAWTWVHLPLEITVYPLAQGSRPLPAGRDSREQGSALSGPGNDEWSGMRPFRDGDSPRRVIWKAYAREQPLLVKEYSGAATNWLLLDFADLPELDPESRLQQICRWVLDAGNSGARYALALPGRRLPADASAAHRERCLRELALCQTGQVS